MLTRLIFATSRCVPTDLLNLPRSAFTVSSLQLCCCLTKAGLIVFFVIVIQQLNRPDHTAALEERCNICCEQEKYTLCSKKSDAKIQITITTAYLVRIKCPLNSFNYHLSDVNDANFNKIHHTVSEQQLF